jgi:hypothetical protein
MTFIADTNARRGLVRIPRLPLVFVLQVWSVKTCQIAPSTSSPRIPRTFLQQLDNHSVGSLGARRQSSRKRPEQHYITNPSSSPSSTFKMSEPPAPLTSMFQATFSNMTDSQLRQTISQLSSAASRPLTRPVPHFRRTDSQDSPLTQYVPSSLTVVPNQLSYLSHSQACPYLANIDHSTPKRIRRTRWPSSSQSHRRPTCIHTTHIPASTRRASQSPAPFTGHNTTGSPLNVRVSSTHDPHATHHPSTLRNSHAHDHPPQR